MLPDCLHVEPIDKHLFDEGDPPSDCKHFLRTSPPDDRTARHLDTTLLDRAFADLCMSGGVGDDSIYLTALSALPESTFAVAWCTDFSPPSPHEISQ
jgi:hypothetical protein